MLCPEVSKFPQPEVKLIVNKNVNVEQVCQRINLNNFYKSIVVTCPDELQTPSTIEDMLTDDTEYYKISSCSLTEFTEPTFIESFVKNGNLFCLSSDRNCVIENCASITPDGMLTLHILDYVFQTLGFEGTKRPHNYFEVKIDLKNLKHYEKVRKKLEKLELFDFYVSWEPQEENICPSSIAKYFCDRKVKLTSHKVEVKQLSPEVTEIPSLKDADIEEVVEWIGLIAHEADLTQTEPYISMYSQPESDFAIKSNRISILIVHGFLTPSIITNVCKKMVDYVHTRELDNFWASISVQSYEDSLWQWKPSTLQMFQAHDSSCTVFFTQDQLMYYLIGQIKYT